METPIFIHAGRYSAPRDHHYPPHKHSCWELVLYREGRIEVPTGDEVFMTRPGLMLLTPPGIVHEERALTAYSNFHLTVEAPADHPWPRMASDDANGTLSFLCRAMVDERSRLQATPEEPGRMLDSMLVQLDIVLRRMRNAPPLSSGEKLVREAETIFESAFAQPLIIAEIAAQMGVASSALRAHFARYRGYSPAESLYRIRLRQALALLRDSDLSLAQVALACGFHSPSHLSRHIKAHTGQAPGRWRREQ
ncbi:MAG TPA: helix-turn-helix domain-containing protein [Abditibacteriaceae bacterium]|jgi:AraC-like DNA-binding protein